MAENSLKARRPQLPSASFFESADNSILTADGSSLLMYDPATQTGLVYGIQSALWTVTGPIAFAEFALMMAGAGLVLTAGDDARRWFDTCSAELPSRSSRVN
jgi:hypothetical protein